MNFPHEKREMMKKCFTQFNYTVPSADRTQRKSNLRKKKKMKGILSTNPKRCHILFYILTS